MMGGSLEQKCAYFSDIRHAGAISFSKHFSLILLLVVLRTAQGKECFNGTLGGKLNAVSVVTLTR
jgi:hypothetical protein